MNVKPGDKIAFVAKGDDVTVKKARTKRLSEVLLKQKPLGMPSLTFQRKIRKEWTS